MDKDAELIKLRVSGEECWFLDADRIEINGVVYHALVKCDENGVPDEERNIIIEKEKIDELGEIGLVPVTDPKEFDNAINMMIAQEGVDAIKGIIDEEGCIEMTDEDGKPVKFELIDSLEHNGEIYHAVIPVGDEDDFVVLKQSINEDGLVLGTVDDDDEYQEIGGLFLLRFSELFAEDDEEDE